ncbi:membrane protein insertase YidC [Brachyspira hyodysenteriae]|uniref:membrane protein insertase YidC n=1 Tax=Brachyspira hyodysenteriae TaxID=159 RepID=UPI001181E708|nr:membrane protein insertase YidC [Brachyspira hyodysenteriae]TVL83162.1 hypothetical protein A9X82_00750 [Brachyspira hyodysenteriae]
MSNNKRMVIAIGLSAIIMFLYMFYQAKTMKPVYNSNVSTNSNAVSNNNNNITSENILLNTAQMQKIEKIENTNAVINDNEKILENEYVIATFKNGSLYSYKLKNYYPQDLGADATNEIIDMVEQVYEGIYPFTVTFQNLSNSIAIPENLDYQLIEESGDKVSYSANAIIDNTEVKITKTFTFGEDPYQLKNSVNIENVGEKDLSLFYSYFLATGIGPYRTDKNAIREDATKAQYLIKGNGKSKILLTGDIVKDNIFSRLFGFGNSSKGIKTNQMRYAIYEGEDKWVALNNRYFAIISSPAQSNNTVFETMTFSKPSTNEYRNDFHVANLMSKHTIKSGSSITDNYSVFMGPKVRRTFSKYYLEESYESIFQESFLGLNLRPLTYILDVILNALYNITKNYAWAILLFTFLFKLVTFPLNHASYKSMKKMQLVNPKIERIREQYKDNPDKLNAEIMAIYKKEKINPLGGCLPILLPFPLLIAFFYLMQSMVELRNTPFLWITDLSSPDKLFVFPAGIPILGGFNFNLFPIVMALTSYLSMKLQPSSSAGNSSAAAQMKMMTTIFPLMMLLMFYNFASGLALYWTAQNIFGVAQQFITSKIDKSNTNEIVEEEETKQIGKKKKRKKR